MTLPDPSLIPKNPANMTVDSQNRLSQVAGTDGSGGGSGGGLFWYKQAVTITPAILSQNFIPLDTVAINDGTAYCYLEFGNSRSPEQPTPESFTIVRSTTGGVYNRLIWDSSLPTNQGGLNPIPDADPAPTNGMQNFISSATKITIYYQRN